MPSTTVSQLRSSLTTWPVVWTRGATNFTSGTSALMARRSSQVSVGSVPAPALAPLAVLAPEETMRTLVPIEAEGLLDAGPRPFADRHHGDDGGDADDDPQRGQKRAQLVAQERAPRHADDVAGAHLRPGHGAAATASAPGMACAARERLDPAIVLDEAVAHDDHPTRVRGDVGLVGDEDDGHPLVVELLQERHHLRLACESRLPVGSSARMRRGRLTSARAIATRCCWPPESWLG